MIKPGSRQHIARIIAQQLEALRQPQPVAPTPSPCEAGFMSRRQAS